ncbi:uncharacterized protein LOC105204611 isoform X2 [Solenopsis invicta]|uniref:uncharacterized protein LOC105204611 isoform X2 n=1 Tax=Solenopsis invicta TaxID=13686 RepID=UPI000E33EA27|nr:uncharacterized protein LOC105204611 isoform X2 [Solenopsis invicta]
MHTLVAISHRRYHLERSIVSAANVPPPRPLPRTASTTTTTTTTSTSTTTHPECQESRLSRERRKGCWTWLNATPPRRLAILTPIADCTHRSRECHNYRSQNVRSFRNVPRDDASITIIVQYAGKMEVHFTRYHYHSMRGNRNDWYFVESRCCISHNKAARRRLRRGHTHIGRECGTSWNANVVTVIIKQRVDDYDGDADTSVANGKMVLGQRS